MPKKPKPTVASYAISVDGAAYGQEVVAHVSPVPSGLFVHFDIRGEDGGVAINWQPIGSDGTARQIVSSPTYQGGPGTGTAFVGDGLSIAPLSNVVSFDVTA